MSQKGVQDQVKQIEIDMDNINIVFRLNPPTENSNNNDGLAKKQNNKNLQHCWRGNICVIGKICSVT